MEFIEYFAHDHLVIHTLRRKGKRTVCGSKVSKMLVARPKDIIRAEKPDTDTLVAHCFECVTGIDLTKVA